MYVAPERNRAVESQMTYQYQSDPLTEFLIELSNEMEIEHWRLARDFAVSVIIAYLTATGNANPTFAVAAIAWVNSVNVGEVVKAYQRVKTENTTNTT